MNLTEADMQVPVSPVSPQYEGGLNKYDGGVIEPQPSRKRSHSIMSQPAEVPAPPAHNSRPGSIASDVDITQNDEFASPRGSRTVKRENPPTNADGKFWCNWSEREACHGQLFDRKCEWSKHMDKHDRPYRCHFKQCEKLQGFTYSGGLLRHQREVHGQHGGPKETLMCPFSSCRRHAGKGFTRKENLNEHLRRVHHIPEAAQQAPASQYAAIDASLGNESLEAAGSHMQDGLGVNDPALAPPSAKRKRTDNDMNGFAAAEAADDIHDELKRLREENERKDERIRQLEMECIQREERLRELQTALDHSQIDASHMVQLDGHVHEDVVV